MNQTESIAALQAQYDALEREGVEKFGGKARQQLEKQLREEMKKKLDAQGGDIAAFKQRKAEVFRKLHAAKAARREDIVSAVKVGTLAPDAAEAEIVSLGFESGVAKADVAGALASPTGHIETIAVPPEPEAVHTDVMDPAGAAEPVTREEVYAEPGRQPEQSKRSGRRNR